MADDITPPESGAGEPADPMVMLAFLQRLITTMSSGGNVQALMAEAPPGFDELFAEAERRAAAGEIPDLGMMLGLFGDAADEADSADEADAADEGRS
jgi:hypothetical protein